jgi:nucleoside-diphosphate-sugar epimerase
MERVFITGATGFIGERLAQTLAEQGHTVHALFRDPAKAKGLEHPLIQPLKGDLSDRESLRRALEGCTQVYHLAALASVWHPNPDAFDLINVQGTQTLLEEARAQGVQRLVITSTAGVLGASEGRETVDESRQYPLDALDTAYERSKARSEQMIREFAAGGLHAVVVNPSRVYGPGLLSTSNSVTKMILGYQKGTWRFIPGDGSSVGNYVFVDDVVQGHLLAMERGRAGERYILGGENASFNEFFEQLAELTGQRRRMLRIPLSAMMAVAKTQQWMADRFQRAPLITPPFVRKYSRNWYLSTRKAEEELGYEPTPLRQGLERTLGWGQVQG